MWEIRFTLLFFSTRQRVKQICFKMFEPVIYDKYSNTRVEQGDISWSIRMGVFRQLGKVSWHCRRFLYPPGLTHITGAINL